MSDAFCGIADAIVTVCEALVDSQMLAEPSFEASYARNNQPVLGMARFRQLALR